MLLNTNRDELDKKGVRKRNQRFRRTHVKTASQYFTNIRCLTLLYMEKSTSGQDKSRFFLYNKKSSSKTKKDTLNKKENKIFNISQKSEYLELILRTRIF